MFLLLWNYCWLLGKWTRSVYLCVLCLCRFFSIAFAWRWTQNCITCNCTLPTHNSVNDKNTCIYFFNICQKSIYLDSVTIKIILFTTYTLEFVRVYTGWWETVHTSTSCRGPYGLLPIRVCLLEFLIIYRASWEFWIKIVFFITFYNG